jgi:hypothetical protein
MTFLFSFGREFLAQRWALRLQNLAANTQAQLVGGECRAAASRAAVVIKVQHDCHRAVAEGSQGQN